VKNALPRLLERIASARIGVIGDFCLDAYLLLDPQGSEISIETGLPTLAVREQRYSLGGAGNVAANLRALGVGVVRVFGVAGDDPFGWQMLRLLEREKVDVRGLLVQREDWQTPTYTKPYEGGQEGRRIDYGNFNALEPETAEALLANLEEAAGELDVLVVNQQLERGLHTPGLRSGLVELVGRHLGLPVLVDSRSYSAEFHGTMRKLNEREAARLAGPLPAGDGLERARGLAEELYRRWNRPLFLSRGEFGCLVHDGEGCREVPGLAVGGPVDPVGAGDSLLAGIAAALAVGEDPLGAAELGNLAAAVTVRKLRVTGTASPAEILAIGASPDYRYHPEIALDPRRANYLEDTDIELVAVLPRRLSLRHAVFDHDGTISTLRQGWAEVMEPVMLKAILGGQPAEGDLYERVRERVRDFIDRTTGVQTLAQMKGLVELVREFGRIPEGNILDEHGYKALYNRELMAVVGRRLARLGRGELEAEDFRIKGALPFLRELAGRGVKLYLASGTDQADAEQEARALGYGELFQGRIYGARGDLEHEPKRVVLERILGEVGPRAAGALATFGDGPVEIRETRKRGGLAVGVASDEVRRFGLDSGKRSRLIQAGADLLVPDFSQWRRLLELLRIEGQRP
jgi:rfaE bifunctional protein kinase chain/domain